MARNKARKILWITDPWETLDHPNDTTLRLATAAQSLGHRSYLANVQSIRLENGQAKLDAREFLNHPLTREAKAFRFSPHERLAPAFFDSIHYRTDPPVNLAYLHPLQILILNLPLKTELVNPASLLLQANEKMEAIYLPKLMPKTLVSSESEKLLDFVRSLGRCVLKPLNEAQSKGVELLNAKQSARTKKLLSSASLDFSQPILLQEYLPGIEKGEQRLWFVDGTLLANVRKLPLKGDFRVNLDLGSRIAPAKMTAREKIAARMIGKFLKSKKIRLAAVDLIDGLITDFNFTSPGLIPQMEAILNRDLAQKIMKQLTR